MNIELRKKLHTFFRYMNLLVGLIMGLVIAVLLPILTKTFLIPDSGESIAPLVYIMIAVGLFWVVISLAIFIRSGKQSSPSHTQNGKPAFASNWGTATTYTERQAHTIVTVAEDEVVQVHFAPVIRSHTADVAILGRQTLSGEENGIILTNHQLIGILIAPSDMEKYGTQNTASKIVDMLPAGPTAGNMGNSYLNSAGTANTLDQMLKNESLSDIVANHYTISIPRSEITKVSLKTIGGLQFKTKTLGNFYWAAINVNMHPLLEQFKSAGLPVND